MANGDDPFGTRLKRARERRHLTQQELADLLGVDRKTVDNWENNRTFPRNRVGALEQWAPELGEDTDPGEAELHATLSRLRDDGIIDAAEMDDLIRKRKRRVDAARHQRAG